MADAPKKPYGDVAYADPGYQDDNKPRYPIDTEDHVRAAWTYIAQESNQTPYTAGQVDTIKSRIKSAGRKFGITFAEDAKAANAGGTVEVARTIIRGADGASVEFDGPVEAIEEYTADGLPIVAAAGDMPSSPEEMAAMLADHEQRLAACEAALGGAQQAAADAQAELAQMVRREAGKLRTPSFVVEQSSSNAAI